MNRALAAGGGIAFISIVAYGIFYFGWSESKSLVSSAQAVRPAPSVAAPRIASAAPSAATSAAATSAAATSAAATSAAATSAAAIPAPSIPDRDTITGSIRSAAPPAPATTAMAPSSAPTMVRKPATVCNNPNAMGVSRTVEIDTTGGPGFGSQHFKAYDFLQDHEVVLTFDDGPWLGHTPAVLKALADQCLKATFFAIGKHSTFYPDILKQVIAAGHTVGSHTWSHADLLAVVKKSGPDAAVEEIEKGASAVHMMAGAPIAPFFRFPDLRHPPEMVTYLGERNIAIFSADVDSWDFKIKKPEELTRSLMAKIQKAGKGIILMHDFQKVTSIALPQILAELQKNGFKVVHMVPNGTLATLPQYDALVLKENKLPTVTTQATERVVRTISQ
jgi:peptidoglycan/xylan/chitin deacetylase (PgdA/CDA1 family)